MNYLPHREPEIKQMLKTIGVGSIDELFLDIPEKLKRARFDLPRGLAELQLIRLGHQLARQNKAPEYLSFLGAGVYEHYIPAVVEKIISLPGFLTPYTPYQAEASQGTLETIFDFQTLVCELFGMEAANASLYDGPTALVEAVVMAGNITGKRKVLVPGTLNPFWKKVLETLAPEGTILIEIPHKDGVVDTEKLEKETNAETSAVICQQPNFFGCLEDVEKIEKITHKTGALLIVAINPISLGLLKRPGDQNADIVVGEGQPSGIPMNFGGPLLGLFATKAKWLRQMPGRLVGKAKDRDGKDAYTLIMQTREQHIRRQRASSNICTNSNLNAIGFLVRTLLLGNTSLATVNFKEAHILQREICKIPGFRLKFPAPFFNEFLIESEGTNTNELCRKLLEKKIIAGLPLEEGLLIAVTETKTKHDIERLVNALWGIKGQTPVGKQYLQISLPDQKFLQETKPDIAQVPEEKLWRVFTRRSEKNFSVDTNFYPLGSCTMKLSPKEIKEAVSNRRFQNIHPLTPAELCQGTLQILYETQRMLSEICGMSQFSLQPAAGAHGEWTGLLIVKAYHRKLGDSQRDTILTLDTAHGTNPASASRAGFKIVVIKSTKDGEVDLEDLTQKTDEKTAALMITLPNTLGGFERKILEITEIVHRAGGLVYMDGANMNALLGIIKPGDMGIDILHLNLHKTFSAPHGGGGPGSGPVGVTARLASFLPQPIVSQGTDGRYYLNYNLPDSIGKVSSFYGNVGVALWAYFYIRALGKKDLKRVARFAVLNANYLGALLGQKKRCMQEFTLKLDPKNIINVAKRLLDYGIHSPTASFPHADVLLIEPTETEDKETLDNFAKAIIEITGDLRERPELVATAPHNMPIERIDQTSAERDQIIKRQLT